MAKILPSHPYLVAEYQDMILSSVDDQDISIRMRALDLLSAMVCEVLCWELRVLMRSILGKQRQSAGNCPAAFVTFGTNGFCSAICKRVFGTINLRVRGQTIYISLPKSCIPTRVIPTDPFSWLLQYVLELQWGKNPSGTGLEANERSWHWQIHCHLSWCTQQEPFLHEHHHKLGVWRDNSELINILHISIMYLPMSGILLKSFIAIRTPGTELDRPNANREAHLLIVYK